MLKKLTEKKTNKTKELFSERNAYSCSYRFCGEVCTWGYCVPDEFWIMAETQAEIQSEFAIPPA